ncbi:hypothetical protein [Bacteroides faecis]|uniref:hypothetical protein n=1 Tax=Bacteroides faecis TaxID=674529 RepID=UPI00202F692F|nr:hypothetical protein [Bacteroides faecis]MCM1731654.1 hypothetical protein [Bacteroides faecis]MCM1768023.1 hypothetical protein [Bacteroides faecis]MCM1773509.1 hypothetical protein [Bacteroides faecis]MCM1920601.1 hypothetical protein [Bacteroides faecis]
MHIIITIFLLLLNYKIAVSIHRYHPNVYLARFLYIYYIVEIIVGLVVVACDYDFMLPVIHSISVPVRDILPLWSLVVLVSGLFIKLGIATACNNGQDSNLSSFSDRYSDVSFDFPINRISRIFAIIFLLSVLFPFIPQFPYALRIITLSFDFLPLFIGLYFNQLTMSGRWLWIFLLFINMAANMVQASRGLAVIPIALFMMGYLVSISKEPSFKKQIVIILLVSAPFFSIFGKIQDFREEFGRGNDVTIENADLLFYYLLNGSSLESKPIASSIADGLGRFINVGDFAIVHMTPSIVPHRGFIQMGEELRSAVTLYGSEGSAKFRENRGDLKYGSGVLSDYGFSVNANTSVGMGLLGDAFSRFGLVGVSIYLFLMAFLITKIELFIGNKYPSVFGIILFLFLAYTFLYTIYGNSYFTFIKKIIFNGLLVFFVSKLITLKSRT